MIPPGNNQRDPDERKGQSALNCLIRHPNPEKLFTGSKKFFVFLKDCFHWIFLNPRQT